MKKFAIAITGLGLSFAVIAAVQAKPIEYQFQLSNLTSYSVNRIFDNFSGKVSGLPVQPYKEANVTIQDPNGAGGSIIINFTDGSINKLVKATVSNGLVNITSQCNEVFNNTGAYCKVFNERGYTRGILIHDGTSKKGR